MEAEDAENNGKMFEKSKREKNNKQNRRKKERKNE
jgi:hypothetical protein